MNHRRQIAGLALVLISLSIFLSLPFVAVGKVGPGAGGQAAVNSASVAISESDSGGISFTLDTPDFFQDETGLQAPGLNAHTTEPGAPRVPYFTTYVAVPPEATVSAEVAVDGTYVKQSEDMVAPVPQPAGPFPPNDDLESLKAAAGNLVQTPDPRFYATDALFPAVLYRLSEPIYYRDLRLVQLDLFPLRFNPVQKAITHYPEISVSVTFRDADWELVRPSSKRRDVAAIDGVAILNGAQANGWRALPAGFQPSATELPSGIETFKIEVNADGIYEVSQSALVAAGMDVGAVDPATFTMLYRGDPVAYEFVGDSDDEFEAGEAVRFYGWAFDGPRNESQYFTNNVYWLWAGGTGVRIADTGNPNGLPVADTFRDAVTVSPDLIYTHTRTDGWDNFPNEGDAWYSERIFKNASVPSLHLTRTITLPHAAATGASADVTVELLSRHTEWPHVVTATLNGDAASASGLEWVGIRNVNVETTAAAGVVIDGVNDVNLTIDTANTSTTWYYLNRITVAYQRHFVADNQQLIFADVAAPHTYEVAGFSEGDAANVLVWDISDRLTPQRVPMQGSNVSGTGPYTYTFGADRSGGASFIATHRGAVLQPLAITAYTPPSLEPDGDGADWVAISHENFMAEVNQLAAHRVDKRYGGLTAHVVDIKDVINQYGYGLPTPDAIHDYLAHALASWTPAPLYVLLVGDSTVNPRNIDCTVGDCSFWTTPFATDFVPTGLVFEDRFLGLLPSDHPIVLLTGDDTVAEMAIGRLAVKTAADAENAIDKIIAYEENLQNAAEWQRNLLFVADDADEAGDFCTENAQVGQQIPAAYARQHLCLPQNPTEQDVEAMRDQMSVAVNQNGITVLNYRGHGGIQTWGGSPQDILSNDRVGFWLNPGRPVVILSMDCLDGHFAFPGYEALSETFIRLEQVGSVAHWSSSGLGYTNEHTVFHNNFYRAVFDFGANTLGEAILHSKLAYEQSGFHESELYGFNLHGDPAMRVLPPNEGLLFLPAILGD